MNIRDEILNQNFPNYIQEYVLYTFQINPKLFEREYRKAKRNSLRAGVGGCEFNLWIAANHVDLKLRSKINPEIFVCYYCYDFLGRYKPEEVIFEHFYPKIQVPDNIVLSCKYCDSFKKDRLPEFYEKIVLDESVVKFDIYVKSDYGQRRLIEFAPLIACHSMGMSNPIWINKMIELAKRYYKDDLSKLFRGQVRYKYYELYRSHWNK